MKVKMISRNPDEYVRETKLQNHKIQRNYDPSLHPLEETREYVRALNSTKLERVFAKPFVGNLNGHRDGVSCFGKHPTELSTLATGAYDGEVRIWDLSNRAAVREFKAHHGFVRGMVYTVNGEHFYTVGDDKSIKMWRAQSADVGETEEPINTILSNHSIRGITHHRKEAMFAICGEVCAIYDAKRNDPLKSFNWGSCTIQAIAYNPVETTLIGCCGDDRSVIFYDQREAAPLRKMVLKMNSNKLAWNPMEAYNFTVASDDNNLYTFDTRALKNPLKIHFDHVSAVTDVDYAPTGKEFVSGSYDKTIRIYGVHHSHSREIYHTKRMQRVGCVAWSFDNRYIFSGSDEMNVRMWKANSSEKLGVICPRERVNFNYQETLKSKFATHPQIKRIANHRQVPRHIMKAQQKMRISKEKHNRKEGNIRKHSKVGAVPFVAEKSKTVLTEEV